MLGILLLAAWVSVSVAIYDDSYFGPKEDGTNRSNGYDKQKFTGSLRTFYKYGTRVVQRGGNCHQDETKNVECNFCTCYSSHWICTRLHCDPKKEVESLTGIVCRICKEWINKYKCGDLEKIKVPNPTVCSHIGGFF